MVSAQKRWIWPFELEEQIGAGGMGVVWRARYVGNNRRVALKLLPDHIASNPTLSARFQRELEILKDLKHPNIVHCFGGTTEGDHWFYAMELVEGGTIESLLREKKKLAWQQAVDFGVQTCLALAHAHSRGIIHRDLKPANLLLTRSGKIKLGDFGLALVSSAERLTSAGKTMGTFLYMSPEQIRGTPELTSKTDLYSLGCVLYEMLAGQAPFRGESAGEVLNMHLQSPPPRVTAVAPDCPRGLEQLILDLLQKDATNRPPDAVTVARRLRSFESDANLADTRAAIDQELTSHAPGVSTHVARAVQAVWRPALLLSLIGILAFSLMAMQSRRLESKSEDLWVRALQHDSADVRTTAARALGELGPAVEKATPALLVRLNDPNQGVREAAIDALGQLGYSARSAASVLIKLQKTDENPTIREHAFTATERIRKSHSPTQTKSLVAILAICASVGVGIYYWKWGPGR